MHATLPLLTDTDFPAVRRAQLDTVQLNMGYVCNQSCVHCHVSAGPNRTESLSAQTAATVLRFIDATQPGTLDMTGGAPELNPNFRPLARAARERGLRVIDRCNLTVLEEPGQEDLAAFLAGIYNLNCGFRLKACRNDGVWYAFASLSYKLTR